MNETGTTDVKYCRNCHYPMVHNARYCEQCGQKYTTGRITFKELFRDFLDEILNIDSKIFKSLGALFIPGRLTNDYFAGRHRRHVHPIRLFFVLAVVFLALFGIWISQNVNGEGGLSNIDDPFYEKSYRSDFMDEFDAVKDSVRLKLSGRRGVEITLDTLSNLMEDPRQNKHKLNYFYLTKDWQLKDTFIEASYKDVVDLPTDEFIKKYEIKSFFSQLFVRQIIRLEINFDDFIRFLIGQTIWMVALMMPLLALILKILYIRRRRYYIEHLIFSFHYHSFFFLIFTLIFVYMLLFPGNTTGRESTHIGLLVSGVAIVYVYLFVAMRRVYKQGFFKTFFKYATLNFLYIFVFILVLTLVAAVSAAIY